HTRFSRDWSSDVCSSDLADSPLVGMTFGEAEAIHDAPLLLALQTGNESRLAPPGDARIWVGSVLGAMGPRQQIADFAQNQFLRKIGRASCRESVENVGVV